MAKNHRLDACPRLCFHSVATPRIHPRLSTHLSSAVPTAFHCEIHEKIAFVRSTESAPKNRDTQALACGNHRRILRSYFDAETQSEKKIRCIIGREHLRPSELVYVLQAENLLVDNDRKLGGSFYNRLGLFPRQKFSPFPRRQNLEAMTARRRSQALDLLQHSQDTIIKRSTAVISLLTGQ